MGNKSNDTPLGGVFVVLGLIVGAMYGHSIGGGVGLVVGAIIGAGLGQVVENIVYQLIVLALGIIWFLARSAFWEGVRDGLSSSVAEPAQYEFVAALPDIALNLAPFLASGVAV